MPLFTAKVLVILFCLLALCSALTLHHQYFPPKPELNHVPESLQVNSAKTVEKPAAEKSPVHSESVNQEKIPAETPAITETVAGNVPPAEKVQKENPSQAARPKTELPATVSRDKPKTVPETKPGTKPEPKPAPATPVGDTDLNSYVLTVIAGYKPGNYPYLLNTDYQNYNGVTEDLYYGGRIVAKAHPSGNRASHCSGITFEVFFKAMQARNRKLGLSPDDFNGMTFAQLKDFQMLWYVASGEKKYNNLAVAIEKYGLGKQIHNWEEAKSGDFLDLSRTNHTGHSVVFIDWVRDDEGKIIGLHYWSSQASTNGIAYCTEYFTYSGKGNVMPDHIYIGRVLPVSSYK